MTTHNDIAEQTKTIVIKRTFDLPVHKVWEAWTKPETMIKWWGPKGYSCPYCVIDLRVGGRYLNAMRGPNGKDMWGTGSYKEVVPMKKLVYTDSFADSEGNIISGTAYNMPHMPMQLMVTVTLEEINGKTDMTLRHADMPEEYYDDCIKGWQSSFDKLEENVK